MNDLRGQKALITGGSRGIGRSIALALAAQGCDLALVARESKELADTVVACEKLGARAQAIVVDLSQDEGPQTALGGCPGDFNLLILNAGMVTLGSALQARWQDWDDMLRLNLRSVMHLTQLALPGLLKQKNPAIIFIASVTGKSAYPNAAGYCASKHGLVGFANALYEDVRGSGVKVSTICPGYVNTDMLRNAGGDGRQVIAPEAIAEAVRFVVSFPASGCPTEITIRSQNPPWP